MSRVRFASLVTAAAVLFAGGAFAQQTTTSVEKKNVEFVYYSDGKVVFNEDGKTMQRDVPADFKVTLDGKEVSVSELVPGQIVQVERTTTTRSYPPTKVMKVREGEVVSVVSRTLVYRENGENKKVTVPSDFKFNVDGRSLPINELRPGMKLTQTIVTETAGATTSGRSVKASASSPPKPAEPPPAVAAAPEPPPPAPAAEPPAEEPKKLPKTGSPLPLVGLSGGALLALGTALSSLRRRIAS